MITDRFVRNIWAINGVIFLGIFIFAFIAAAVTFISDFDWGRDTPSHNVIVGKDFEKARKEGLALQGIEYGDPTPIYRSDLFLITISAKTYQTPKDLGGSGLYKSSYAEEESAVINALFLDAKLNVINTLTDKKIFIKSLVYPSKDYEGYYSDTVQHNIIYTIATQDTDSSGTIGFSDDDDLYISELDGSNFRQITKNIDVASHTFLDSDRILIRYRTRNEQPEEHKRVFFALFWIKENKLEELTSLEKALDNVEKTLVK
jgi:hypothetical protein